MADTKREAGGHKEESARAIALALVGLERTRSSLTSTMACRGHRYLTGSMRLLDAFSLET